MNIAPIDSMRIVFLSLWILVHSGAPAQAQEQFWGQPFGGPQRTSSVEMPGVMSQPELVWSLQFDEIMAGPVSWADAVFVVAIRDGDLGLFMLQAATGETLDLVPIRAEGPFWLGVRQQNLVVVAADKLLRYRYKKDDLGNAKVVRGEFRPMGLITDDLFVTRALNRDAVIFDLDRMRELHRTVFGESEFCYSDGQLITVGSPVTDRAALGSVRLYLAECQLQGRKLSFPKRPLHGSHAITRAGAPVVETLVPVVFLNRGEDLCVIVRVPSGLGRSAGADQTWTSFPLDRALSEIEGQAAWHERGMFGVDTKGRVMIERPDSSDARLMETDEIPEGAMSGAASRAGDVLYVQNWAFDLGTDQVLWKLDGPKPDQALVPLPDRRFLARYADSTLRCFGESEAVETVVTIEELHADFLAETAAMPATCIGDGPAVILLDGTRVPGELVGESEEHFTVRHAERESHIPRALVAAIEREGRIESFDGGSALIQAWSRFVQQQFVSTLDDCFQAFAKLRLADDCTRLIAEARQIGVTEQALAKWADRLARIRPVTETRTGYGKRAYEAESETRLALLQQALEVAQLCTDSGLGISGGAVLALERSRDSNAEAWQQLDVKVLDHSFPRQELGEDVALWLDWCAELAEINASFISPEDAIRASWSGSRWENALAIRAPRAVIVTEVHDVQVVGPAVRVVERALRVLEHQFGEMLRPASEHPVEIRVFASQQALLEAQEGETRTLSDWVVGYSGEADGVIRVCAIGDSLEERAVELNTLVCGLVTRAYLERIWPQESASRKLDHVRGVWAARGLGQLIRIQSLDIMRGDLKMDSFRYPQFDMLCQIARTRLPYRISGFFDASSEQFLAIDPGETVGMRVRTSPDIFPDNAQRAFTRQSAGLVYFFMHRCKRSGKDRLLEYLMLYGRGETPEEGWKFFGYETAEELDLEFQNFLLELDGRFN